MRIAITGAAGIAALLLPLAAAAQTPPPAPRSKDPAHADAPPNPPTPGLAPPPPAPVAAPVFTADTTVQGVKEPPLAGWHGSFFLRDPGDYFRLYPRGRLNLDFNSWPGGPTGLAKDGGVNLQPRFFIRRLRLELAGQFFTNFTFHVAGDFGGQPISNANGKNEQSAAAAGADPTASTARYAAVEAVSPNAVPVDVFLNYAFCDCLNLMIGQGDVAFSMENQTSDNITAFMERSIGVTFAVPSKKDIGLTVWGDLFDKRLSYGLEIMAGDGQNRPQIDNNPDFAGRIFTRPLLGSKNPLEKLQVGVSARTGQRDPKFVGYDYAAMSTMQAYALWTPTYKDSLGRTIHVIPSGDQNAIGGELRLPFSIFDVRAEAYYVANNTRESVDGYQLADKGHTERLGQMSGVGWYVHASVWPFGDTFVTGDPGFFRPTVVNFSKEIGKPRRGFEVMARVSGVNADYQGNSRGGAADPNTATKETGSKITIYEYSFGLNYWYTRHLRLGVDYSIYHAPDSLTDQNRAVVPANLGAEPDDKEHIMHELGARAAVWF